MSNTSIQELLPLVQQPSRYLGNEMYRVKKDWDQINLHIALAFPDLYEIATSHFGIQILYGILNNQEDILAERVFAPAEDLEAHLRKRNGKLCSLESQTPLHQFDIIGFSLLYELNYTNMVNMINLAGLPFFADQRSEADPVLIAGGPCMCNPEPVADFFDAIVVGDGEPVIIKMTNEWKKWRKSKQAKKKDLLTRWSTITGVYVPSFFKTPLKTEKREKSNSNVSFQKKVSRSVASDLNDAFFPQTPVIPFGKPIHDRLRMEIARGCTRGCRFCQAGMIYRPVRERDPKSVVDSVHSALEKTGYEDLSLLSLSTGDYACIAPLMKKIMEFGQQDHVAVSLPSLRAGSLTPELMELIKKVRKTGFTIAPEAGSQRLRDVINKNITQEDIEKTVENAFELGWKLIKLYFMIGLPTETQEDLQEIVSLVKKLKIKAKSKGKAGKINVSVATFVPKPHTPFQWEPQISLETAIDKISWLREQLKIPGIHVKWQDPKVSIIEGVWSRGDRKLSPALIKAWERGCRFDGWSDHFNFNKWQEVFADSGIDQNDYLKEKKSKDEKLPWDHIDMGINRDFLIQEKEKAVLEKITDDCRTGNCGGCGVCDFTALKPVSYHGKKIHFTDEPSVGILENDEVSITYGVTFSKMGEARFLGHLEMIKLFVRALRRENVPLRYSGGFHPMPKISFLDTLPVGMQSEDETMLVKMRKEIDSDQLVIRLGQQLPAGIDIIGCSLFEKKDLAKQGDKRTYTVQLNDGFFDEKKLDWFQCQKVVTVEKKSKKNKRVKINLKNAVCEIARLNSSLVRICLKKESNLTIRPSQAIEQIFDLTEHQLLTAIITKKNQTMYKKIIINVADHETRVALVEDETIVELFIERKGSRDNTGNIYKGRVQRVLPGMQAAFVDIGLNQAAFIYVDDVIRESFPDVEEQFTCDEEELEIDNEDSILQRNYRREEKENIEELINEGQEILVQVSKSPIGTKGARITSNISLPGRFLVLMPTSAHIGISRRIEDETERMRLKEIVNDLSSNSSMGYIVRTAAEGVKKEKIAYEMGFLKNLWCNIQKKYQTAGTPSLLHQELNISLRAVRDLLLQEAEKLVIDSRKDHESVLTFLDTFNPSLKESVELYEGIEPIFDAFNLEGDISRALKRKVWLKSGGYIVIEHTEALVAIDVNTGRYVGKYNLEETILKTNLEAVKEIAYQIRLRDIGGIIIIDFIDMEKKSNQEKVFSALNEGFTKDRSKTHILPISEMGLIQMTRKRTRKPLTRLLCDPCPYCDGEGYIISIKTICYSIYREVLRYAADMTGSKLTIRVNPEVADFLHGEENYLISGLEKSIGKQIMVYPDSRYHMEAFEIIESTVSSNR